MKKPGGSKRLVRIFGIAILVGSVTLGLGSFASATDQAAAVGAVGSATQSVAPGEESMSPTDAPAVQGDSEASSLPPAIIPAVQASGTSAVAAPYGAAHPVTLETDFSRPYKSISSAANSDFSLLNDLERLIRGSYQNPNGSRRSESARKANVVYLSISRMEHSHRVGRELVRAAKAGVTVRVIHGKASQSKDSRALQSSLAKVTYKGRHTGAFHICQKGKSLACLSSLNGAIMHSKILYVKNTFTRDNKPAIGAIWSGSANLGGPSGERTYNNGWTVYNDRKLNYQIVAFWKDMWAERNIGNNYPAYVARHKTNYGYRTATSQGYTDNWASHGMFYSNLANVTIYPTPIYATPSNGRDPVLNALNRVIPDDNCRIRIQHNRFKYRRIAVAQKLVELSNKGCEVQAIAFEDNLKVNRTNNCQLHIRICKPILDVFRTANQRIETAWAKPHDKTMLIDARMTRNKWNTEERLPTGGAWPSAGVRVKFVQAGSAALTGSNLVVSDEITTETTDPQVFEDYLEHWKAIWKSKDHQDYVY